MNPVSLMFSEQTRAVKILQITSLAWSRLTDNYYPEPGWSRCSVFVTFMTTSKSWFEFTLFVSHRTSIWPQCKKDKQMVNRWVLRPLWTALCVYSGDGMEVLNHSKLHCSLTCSILGYVFYMSKQDVPSSWVMILRTSSPAHHPICIAHCCLCTVLTLFFSKALQPWFAPLL